MNHTPGLLFILLSLMITSCGEETTQIGKEGLLEPQGNCCLEAHRPQFHFSPDSMWMNDPNGMVFYEGEYHLFYQFYPDSNVWGPMHWGHAVSLNMVHWEHLPIALYPDSLGYIFSGSAVVDWKNTTGFGTDESPAMIAIFTHHDPIGSESGSNVFQYQSIAYSNDKGRTWIKYAGNPVLPNPGIRDFRDPKVSWNEDLQAWTMICAANDEVQIYTSIDLKSWEKTDSFGKETGAHGGVWECPDLFPLMLNGEEKWVMLVSINPGGPNSGSATQYFIGDFSHGKFTMDAAFATRLEAKGPQWLDYGRDNYAGVTWSDIPESDGRRLFLGWMSNWDYAQVVPTKRWRSAMTLPRELSLRDGPFLMSVPIKEVNALREAKSEIGGFLIANGTQELELGRVALNEFQISFEPYTTTAQQFGVRFQNLKGESLDIGYDRKSDHWYVDRRNSGVTDFSEKFASRDTAPANSPDVFDLRIFLDRSSVEVFFEDGEQVMTTLYFASEPFDQIQVFAEGGEAMIDEAIGYELETIWKNQDIAN